MQWYGANGAKNMKEAKVVIRKDLHGLFWGTVKLIDWSCLYSLSYETELFNNVNELLNECRAFCKWKKLKIGKIVKLY